MIIEVPDERLNILRVLLGNKFGLHYHVAHYSRLSLFKLLSYCRFTKIDIKYQFKSSYRGNMIPSILAIAQKTDKCKTNKLLYSTVFEILSFISFVLRRCLLEVTTKFREGQIFN
jgi:hypothetical protein